MKETLSHQVYNTFKSDLSTEIHRNDISSKHFHKNAELLICIQGTCHCQINNQNYVLIQGEAIFICPLQVHSFSVPEGSVIRRITYHEHLILTISKSLMGRIPKNPVFKANSKVLGFCLDFLDEVFGTDNRNLKKIEPFELRMQIKGILHLLGGEFLRQAELIPTPKVDNFALDIFQYIADNFEQDISLKEIAKQKGYNYQYVSRGYEFQAGSEPIPGTTGDDHVDRYGYPNLTDRACLRIPEHSVIQSSLPGHLWNDAHRTAQFHEDLPLGNPFGHCFFDLTSPPLSRRGVFRT